MSFRKLLRQWFSSARRPLDNKRRSSTARAKGWLQLERLEERLAPATFTDNGTSLSLVLNNPSANVTIVSTTGGYSFNLTGDTWSGTNTARVTGNGSSVLAVTPAGIAAFTSQISLVGAQGAGDSVTFSNLDTSDYANNFLVDLSNATAGPITFEGTTTFADNFSLEAITTSAINFQGGASVPYQGTVTIGVDAFGEPTISMPNGPGWTALGFALNDTISVTNPNSGTVSTCEIDDISGSTLFLSVLSGASLTSGTDQNVTVAVNSAQVSADNVSLTAGNSLTVQPTGVPYMGGVTIHAAPQTGQPFAGEQYITGPEWGSYGYQPGDTIKLSTNSNGVYSNYTVANIAGDNLYLISSQTIATGTDPDVTVACANFTPEIVAVNGIVLDVSGDGNTISGAIDTQSLDAVTTNGNITLQDVNVGTAPSLSVGNVSVGDVDAGTAQIQLNVAGAIVPAAPGSSSPELIAGSVDLTTTGAAGSIGTGAAIMTQTEELTAATNDGSINIINTGPLTINSVVADQDGQAPTVNDDQIVYNSTPNQSTPTYKSGSSDVIIISSGPVVLNSISATGTATIQGESIVEGNAQSQDIVAQQVALAATGTANYQGQVTFANLSGAGAEVSFTAPEGAINSVATTPAAGGSGYPANSTFDLDVTGGGGTGGVVQATTNSSGVVTSFAATPVLAGSAYSTTNSVTTAGCDTLTLPNTGPTWTSFGFAPGDAIVVSGASAMANDATFTTASISPDGYTLTLTASYVLDPETEPDVTVGDGMIGLASHPLSASAANSSSSTSSTSSAIALSEVGSFYADTTNGNIYLALGGAVDCTAEVVNAGGTGNVSVTSAANFLTVESIKAPGATPTGGNAVLGGNITLDVSDGSLLEYGLDIIQGQTVSLTSGFNIGSPSSPIMTNAVSGLSVAATADSPSSTAAYVDNTSNLTSVGASTYDGNVLISYNGSNGSYAGQLSFSNNVLSESGGAVVTFANTDDNDGSADNVVLSGAIDLAGITAGGQILAQPLSTEVTGQFVTLSAGDGIGVPGNSILTDVAALVATTNTGGIYIQNQNPSVFDILGNEMTFAPNPQGAGDTMTLPASGPNWPDYGYAPGDTLVVSGASAAANNGDFTIASISPDGFTVTLTVSGVLHAEPNAAVTVYDALPLSASTSNGNIDVSSEFDMILGDISTNANGTVTLDAGQTIYNPNLVNAKNATVSGGTLVLAANGVGTASNPLETSVTTLTANLPEIGDSLFLSNNSSLAVTSSNIGGSVSISATGNVTLQGPLQLQPILTGSVSLTATGGALTTTGTVSLDEPTVTISAEQIGSPTDVIQTGAATINATATYGGIYISNNAEQILTLTAAAVGPEPGGVATNNIEIYNSGSIIIDPQTGSLVGSQPVGLYNPGGALTLYAGETLGANGQTTSPGMSGTTIVSNYEGAINPGAYYDVFTGAPPTIVTQGNSSGVSPSLQIVTGQSEPQVTQPGGGSGPTSPPLLITEAKLEQAGGGTFSASSIIIDDDMDSNGQSATINLTEPLTLTATNGPIVFLNPEDTLAIANGGTITINAEGSNGAAVLGNLTTGGGSITVSAAGNIDIGAVNAGSGQVTITSTSGSIFSSNGTALAISAGSTKVQGAGQPASASQSASLAELNATQAIATADAAGSQAAAEQTTANAFSSELASINSQLTSIQTAVSNDQQNYQSDEQVVANDTNTVNADRAVVTNETIAYAALNTASEAAALISATTDQIATGLYLSGAIAGLIPVVGQYLADALFAASAGVKESSDAFDLLSTVESFAGAILSDQQMADNNKLNADSNTLATDQSNEAQAHGQLQADLDTQTALTDEYDATLVAYDIAQQAATNDQMIALQDQTVSGQAIAALAATATPPSLKVNGPVTLANQANVLIPSGATIQAPNSTITITGDTTDEPSGANVTVAGTLTAASALVDVPTNSTGPDTFTITPSATTPITVTGGAGTDTLNFNAAGLAVTLSGNTITAAGMQPVTFTNIAVVNITDAANGGASYTLAGTSGQANTLSLVGTAQGAGTATLNGAALSFRGVDSFNYQGGNGDTISVTPFTASGLPWNVAVTVVGGSGSPASLTYDSVASLADTVTPTGADAGTIGSPGLASVQFSNVGTVTTNASQSPGDQLTVNLPGTSAHGAVNTLDAQQTAAGTVAFTLNAFSVPFSMTSIGYGSVNLSDTTGTALFEVGVAAALETTPTASVNFLVVGSPVYNDHLLVQDEGGEPRGFPDVISPSGIAGSGLVTVGALNPVSYQNISSVKFLPTVTVADAGGTLNGKPFAATAQVDGGPSLNGIKPTLTYYRYSGTSTPTVNYYSGTFTLPAGAVRLSGAPTNAGTYAVVASFAGAGTYASNWAWTTITISQVKPQVSGSAITNPVGLTVNFAPIITLQPVRQTVAVNTSAVFTAAANGTPSATVQWQVSTNGGQRFSDIAGATSTTLTLTPAMSDSGNQYRAVFTNALGKVATKAAGLVVEAPPSIVTNPSNQTRNAGQIATFTATASGTALVVQWQVSTDGVNFTNIAGANSLTLAIEVDAAHNGRQYRVVFTDPVGQTISTAAMLTVNSAPIITASPANQTVTLGTAVSFTAEASGNPSITAVQWQVSTDGGSTFSNIEGATSLTLSFTPTRSDSGKRFRAVFLNALGRTVTRSALLTVVA